MSRSYFHRRSASLTAIIIGILICQSGCVATKYKLARKDSPPVQPINIAFPPSPPLQVTLAALISYGGPGSWKRKALWDEYVIRFENKGDAPLTVESARLTDSTQTSYAPGNGPWSLEKQSKKLEKQYRDHGEAFVRAAGPGVVLIGVVATVSATAGSEAFVAAGVAGASVAAIGLLPVYYLSVLGINHHNKKAVMTEFNRRRLLLPRVLAPGETWSGSLFFPMLRSPDSLTVYWSGQTNGAPAVLPLDFLHTLHLPAAPEARVSK